MFTMMNKIQYLQQMATEVAVHSRAAIQTLGSVSSSPEEGYNAPEAVC